MPASESISTGHAVAPTVFLSRRSFLEQTASGVALGALAALGLPGAAFSAPPAASSHGLRFIGAAEYPVFARLIQAMLPLADSAFTPLERIPVMRTLDRALLGTMPPDALRRLKGGVKTFESAPLPTYGKRFSELDDREAAAFCDAWADSPQAAQRGLVTALKKLVALAYWANPATWPALGYDGPVSRRRGLKSIGNAPMPVV